MRGTRRQILNEHVGPGGDAFQQCRIVRILEIQHQGFLAAIEPYEVRAPAIDGTVVVAREVSPFPFDFDDPGTGIGETRRAERCRYRLLQ